MFNESQTKELVRISNLTFIWLSQNRIQMLILVSYQFVCYNIISYFHNGFSSIKLQTVFIFQKGILLNDQWLVKWRHLERLFLKQEFIVVANNKVVWLSESLSLTIDPGQPLQSVKIPELKAFILFSFAEKIFIASMDPNLEQQHKLEHILSRWHIFWWRVNKQLNLTQFD